MANNSYSDYVPTYALESIQRWTHEAQVLGNRVLNDIGVIKDPHVINLMAKGLWLASAVMFFHLANEHNLIGRFIPGGRDLLARRALVKSLTFVAALGLGGALHNGFLALYGVPGANTQSDKPMRLDPSLNRLSGNFSAAQKPSQVQKAPASNCLIYVVPPPPGTVPRPC